jgi:hypothetical protein
MTALPPNKMLDLETTNKTPGRTPEEIVEQQKRNAELLYQQNAAASATEERVLTTTTTGTAVAEPGSYDAVDRYLDQVAPVTSPGRKIRFNGKVGVYSTVDDGTTLGDKDDYVALVDQTLLLWLRFYGPGVPPDKIGGLLFEPGYMFPRRDALGETDASRWEIGLDGKPRDPWVHSQCVVLQRGDDLFCFETSSKTGHRAVGELLRAYKRGLPKHPDCYPIVRLRVGMLNLSRIGSIPVPRFDIRGWTSKDDAATPDGSTGNDMSDEIPW